MFAFGLVWMVLPVISFGVVSGLRWVLFGLRLDLLGLNVVFAWFVACVFGLFVLQ